MQALDADEVHVVEGQFGEFWDCALHEDVAFVRVESGREVVECDFDDVLPNFFWVVGIVGKCLCVGYHDEDLVKFTRVLKFYSSAE